MRQRKIHHTSNFGTCPSCNKPFKFYWYDKEQKNGYGQTRYTSKHHTHEICRDCVTKENNGLPPLGLGDLNEIRERGITKDQYYKEQGYKIINK